MTYIPPRMPHYEPPARRTELGPVPSPEALQAIEDELQDPAPKPEPPKPQPLTTGDPHEKPSEQPPVKPGQPRRRTFMTPLSVKNYEMPPEVVRQQMLGK